MEGTTHYVPTVVAKMSKMIESFIHDQEDDDDDDDDGDGATIPKVYKEFPVPNVKDAVLTKVIEYCDYYTFKEAMTDITTPFKSTKFEDLVQTWYFNFFKALPQQLMFDLVAAANYMDIKPLLDLSTLAVSIHIKGKSEAELCALFNFSEEEADANQRPV